MTVAVDILPLKSNCVLLWPKSVQYNESPFGKNL